MYYTKLQLSAGLGWLVGPALICPFYEMLVPGDVTMLGIDCGAWSLPPPASAAVSPAPKIKTIICPRMIIRIMTRSQLQPGRKRPLTDTVDKVNI